MSQNGPVAILPELREFLIKSLSIILPNEHLHFSQLTKKDQPIPLVNCAVVLINRISADLMAELNQLERKA